MELQEPLKVRATLNRLSGCLSGQSVPALHGGLQSMKIVCLAHSFPRTLKLNVALNVFFEHWTVTMAGGPLSDFVTYL